MKMLKNVLYRYAFTKQYFWEVAWVSYTRTGRNSVNNAYGNTKILIISFT